MCTAGRDDGVCDDGPPASKTAAACAAAEGTWTPRIAYDAASGRPSNYVSITFDQQSGDVPALIARTVDPRDAKNVAVTVATDGATHGHCSTDAASPCLKDADCGSGGGTCAKDTGAPSSVRGTREQLECSGRGTCDRSTGVCSCFSSYASSDGNGNAGTNADCGHRLPYDVSHLKGGA